MSMSKFIPTPLAALMSMVEDAPALSPEMSAAVESLHARDMAALEALEVQQAQAEFAKGGHTLH